MSDHEDYCEDCDEFTCICEDKCVRCHRKGAYYEVNGDMLCVHCYSSWADNVYESLKMTPEEIRQGTSGGTYKIGDTPK